MVSTVTLQYGEFYYFQIELKPDPKTIESLQKSDEQLNVDLLTWKQKLTAALSKLYGTFGSAKPFDILHTAPSAIHNDRFVGPLAWIRVAVQDKEEFHSAVVTYVFQIDDSSLPASFSVMGESPSLSGLSSTGRDAWIS